LTTLPTALAVEELSSWGIYETTRRKAEAVIKARLAAAEAGRPKAEPAPGLGQPAGEAMGAYTISDRGTWLSFGNKGDLTVLVEGGVGSHLGAERHMIVRSRARRVRSQAKWLSAVTRTSNLSALAPVCASAMFRRRGLRVLAR
jgi:hypothetical protein